MSIFCRVQNCRLWHVKANNVHIHTHSLRYNMNRKRKTTKARNKLRKQKQKEEEEEWVNEKTLSTIFSLTICSISSKSVVAFPSSVFNDNEEVYRRRTWCMCVYSFFFHIKKIACFFFSWSIIEMLFEKKPKLKTTLSLFMLCGFKWRET